MAFDCYLWFWVIEYLNGKDSAKILFSMLENPHQRYWYAIWSHLNAYIRGHGAINMAIKGSWGTNWEAVGGGGKFITIAFFVLISIVLCVFLSLKRKCLHFDEMFITGCTGSHQNDNFQCSQWRKFRQNDDIFVSGILYACSMTPTWNVAP